MKKIYVILDAMSTGNIPDVRTYLENFSDKDYSLTLSNHYFEYETLKMNEYHLKYMLVDLKFSRFHNVGPDYQNELARRIRKTVAMGFKIVLVNLWEDYDQYLISNMKWKDFLTEKCELNEFYQLTGGNSYFWYYMFNMYQKQTYVWNHSHKPYDFLYLNKKVRPLRKYLYDQLKQTDILDNSLYTWWDKTTRVKLPEQYELPEVKNDYPYIGMDQLVYFLPYEHTKVSLISETVVEQQNNRHFITEKLWKPIICEQPFVVFGYQHFLKNIRTLGFKTFDCVWDESYDDVEHKTQRADDIVRLCSKIKNMDSKELYQNTHEIREHNRKLFFDKNKLSEVITRDIKLAFEIY